MYRIFSYSFALDISDRRIFILAIKSINSVLLRFDFSILEFNSRHSTFLPLLPSVGTVPFQCVLFNTVVHTLQEADRVTGVKSLILQCLCHCCVMGRGIIIKLGNWSTRENTNPLGIPATARNCTSLKEKM